MLNKWDKDAISSRFKSKASSVDTYLREVSAKVKTNKSYEFIYDEYLALSEVYNFLYEKTFLNTKESLVRKLKDLLESEGLFSNRSYHIESYYKFRTAEIQCLINEFQEGDQR